MDNDASNKPIPPAPLATPRDASAPPLLVVGVSARYAMPAVSGISAQWADFMARCDGIDHATDAAPLGVSLHCDDQGNFEYMTALEVTELSDVPTGMVAMQIPAQRYAVFQHNGPIATLAATYAAIWSQWLPAHAAQSALDDGAMLERYSDDFDAATGAGGVAIWGPVKSAPPP